MNLRVFKISGKSQRSQHNAKFTGFFIKMDGTNSIEGYMEEHSYTPYDPVRYIEGLYIEEEKRLGFAVMCNNMVALVYVFSNLKNQGFWSAVPHPAVGILPDGKDKRRASVQLKEVQDENEKRELVQKVATVKAKGSNFSGRSYQEFYECVKRLPYLFKHYDSGPFNSSSASNANIKNVSKEKKKWGKNSKRNKKKR